jgi:hypothetical protein
MKTTKSCRKAQVKSTLQSALTAFAETSWAIATGLVVGFATPSIHAKGAPRKG